MWQSFQKEMVTYVRKILLPIFHLRFGRSGKMLLSLASTVILSSESHRTHDHVILSQVVQLCLHSFGTLTTFLYFVFQILWTALSLALGLEIRGEIIRGVPCIKRFHQLFCPTAGNSYPM